MSFLKLKDTVMVPRVVIIAAALINAANVLGLHEDMLITSGNDSTHMKGSKHYKDEALDFRTKHLVPANKRALIAELQRRLGRHFDVLLESENGPNEHGHAEWDPKS